MKNYVSKGENVSILGSAVKAPNNPPKSGDPAVSLAGVLSGVVANDVAANTDTFVLVTKGVFNVSIVAAAAMPVGSIVYIAAATAVLSDTNTGIKFGVLLEAIAGASTVTRAVKLFGQES